MTISFTPADVAFSPAALDLTEGDILELQPTDAAISPVSINLSENPTLRLTPTPATFVPVSAFLGATGTSITLAPTAATLARVPLTLRSDPVVALPAVIPSSRVLRPSKHPLSLAQAQSGASEARLWASAAGGASMELAFRAITDADAEAFMMAHDAARGGRAALSVPPAIYEGLSPTLLPFYDLSGTGLAWAFDGPPRTRSVAEGYADVEVRLRARRVVRNSFVSAGVAGVDLESGSDSGSYGDCDVVGDLPDPLPIDPDNPVPPGFTEFRFTLSRITAQQLLGFPRPVPELGPIVNVASPPYVSAWASATTYDVIGAVGGFSGSLNSYGNAYQSIGAAGLVRHKTTNQYNILGPLLGSGFFNSIISAGWAGPTFTESSIVIEYTVTYKYPDTSTFTTDTMTSRLYYVAASFPTATPPSEPP